MLSEKEAREREKQARMIGPFIFDNDEDIDCEVLNNELVHQDLKELQAILGENLTED